MLYQVQCYFGEIYDNIKYLWQNGLLGDLMLQFQWSRILKFPDTMLFSKIDPLGMSIFSPWFAMIITVPLSDTPFPKDTSPDTVRWSNCTTSGIVSNRFKKSCTYGIKKFRYNCRDLKCALEIYNFIHSLEYVPYKSFTYLHKVFISQFDHRGGLK